jgi:hypothetical protein
MSLPSFSDADSRSEVHVLTHARAPQLSDTRQPGCKGAHLDGQLQLLGRGVAVRGGQEEIHRLPRSRGPLAQMLLEQHHLRRGTRVSPARARLRSATRHAPRP